MKRQQAEMATAQATSNINTSLPDSQIIPANLTAYYAPLQLPQDATALAEAMAASAGPDNTKKTPEQYLAEAQSALASYTSPPTPGPLSQAASSPAAVSGSTDGRRHRKLLQTGNTVIDYLVVYTPAVVTAQGGEANAQNTIRNTVTRLNAIYVNSGVQITINLVGMRRVSVHTQLPRLLRLVPTHSAFDVCHCQWAMVIMLGQLLSVGHTLAMPA